MYLEVRSSAPCGNDSEANFSPLWCHIVQFPANGVKQAVVLSMDETIFRERGLPVPRDIPSTPAALTCQGLASLLVFVHASKLSF